MSLTLSSYTTASFLIDLEYVIVPEKRDHLAQNKKFELATPHQSTLTKLWNGTLDVAKLLPSPELLAIKEHSPLTCQNKEIQCKQSSRINLKSGGRYLEYREIKSISRLWSGRIKVEWVFSNCALTRKEASLRLQTLPQGRGSTIVT